MTGHKVVHVSSVHPAMDTRIFVRECTSLAAAGYEVTLLANPPAPASSPPGIRLGILRQPGHRLGRFAVGAGTAIEAARCLDADIYHLHDPELLPYVGRLRSAGAAVVYDAHEDLPLQVLGKPWLPSFAKPVISSISAHALPLLAGRADAVVAATPTVAKRFTNDTVAIVHNYPLLSELEPAATSPYSVRDNIVVYVGGLATIRGAVELYRAIGLVRSDLGARLEVIGRESPEGLREELERLPGARRVDFLGWQGREAVVAAMARARVGVVALHPMENYVDALPTKLFEYMAAGLPVVASRFPLWREIVEGARCGITVDPLRPEEIADAVEWLLRNPREAAEMGQNGLRAARERYSWISESRRLLSLYRELLDRKEAG